MGRATSKQRLWHGGAPGRQVGDQLAPPAKTGLRYTRLHQSIEEGQRDIAQRLDRVYVTTDRYLALGYASAWSPDGRRYRGGSLYLVDCDELEPDEDLLSLPGLSFQARSARIIAVAKVRVPFDPERTQRKMNEIVTRLERAKRAVNGE